MTINELYNKIEERFDNNDLWWLYVTLNTRFSKQPTFSPYVSPLKKHSGVKRVIFNPPATIIFWTDNTKSVVKCQNGEEFDPEKGFTLAYLKKLLGNDNTFNKEINKWVKYDAPVEEKETKWRVVDRPAEVGDYIRLIECDYSFDAIGDILKVDDIIVGSGAVQVYGKNHTRDTGNNPLNLWCYTKREYEVVEEV